MPGKLSPQTEREPSVAGNPRHPSCARISRGSDSSASCASSASSASRLLSPLATNHSPLVLPNRHKLPFKTSSNSLKTIKSGTV